MENKFLHSFIFATIFLTFFSCGSGINDYPSNGKNDNGNNPGSLGKDYHGQVTYYSTYDAPSVAYYVPEIENGWYKCAVSEPKLNEFPPNTALEILYNGSKIHALVTDLCPSSDNAQWTSQADYYFDLGENAFEALIKNKSLGHTYVDFKTVPYPTKKNIFFQAKDGINDYWIAGRFYNLRYPLKKVEISFDGKKFIPMERLLNSNNWYKVETNDSQGLSKNKVFRLTDIYGHTITSQTVGQISGFSKHDLGKNFDY